MQWWAAQPAATVPVSPTTTIVLAHVPTAEPPILLHIGTKRPQVAHYVQQYAGQQTILGGTIAYNHRSAEPEPTHGVNLQLADQLSLAHLPAPTLRINTTETVTASLCACSGVLTRSAAEWDHPLAPASCISCHYKAHLANLTIRPNESHCNGTFLHALLAEALCIKASCATTGPGSTAIATVQQASWTQQSKYNLTWQQLPDEIQIIIVLARKTHEMSTGPRLHPAIV